jgi:hypothetical protein
MRVAFGLKAHSGWAALVGLGVRNGEVHVIARSRMELIEKTDAPWAKQPYHAAKRSAGNASDVIRRAVEGARRIAVREMRSAVDRAREAGYDVGACAVLVVDPLPGWTVDEILAVHFRMHKAEGVLFRDSLVRAADACSIPLVAIVEKQLSRQAKRALGTSMNRFQNAIASLGKTVGAPWGVDQKDAALAALIALRRKRT